MAEVGRRALKPMATVKPQPAPKAAAAHPLRNLKHYAHPPKGGK